MIGTPWKIGQKVDGSFTIEKGLNTHFIYNVGPNMLEWRKIGDIEVLSLDEIFDQVKEIEGGDVIDEHVPLIRIIYDTPLSGVIFEVGNYPSLGRQWIVYGITKGYA